jgi:hypothetical protein
LDTDHAAPIPARRQNAIQGHRVEITIIVAPAQFHSGKADFENSLAGLIARIGTNSAGTANESDA